MAVLSVVVVGRCLITGCIVPLEFGFVLFRSSERVNMLYQQCTNPSLFGTIPSVSGQVRMSKIRVDFTRRSHSHVLGFSLSDGVTTLIHILSSPDIICMRISPKSVNVTCPRQGITTGLSY